MVQFFLGMVGNIYGGQEQEFCSLVFCPAWGCGGWAQKSREETLSWVLGQDKVLGRTWESTVRKSRVDRANKMLAMSAWNSTQHGKGCLTLCLRLSGFYLDLSECVSLFMCEVYLLGTEMGHG